MKSKDLPRWMFVTALGVTALLWAQFGLRPTLAAIGSKKQLLVTSRGEISRGENFTRGLDDLTRYLNEFAATLDELDRLVPKEIDSEARVNEVNAIAQQLALPVTSVRPDPPVPHNGITAHPLTIGIRGEYLAIEKFLYAIENLEQHSRVTFCQIQRADKSSDAATIVATIELTSYSLAGEAGG
jgi:Tfp pilus assembly protein PilO